MLFQAPTASFDPRTTVGESVAEPPRIHGMRDGERRRPDLVETPSGHDAVCHLHDPETDRQVDAPAAQDPPSLSETG